MDNSSYLPVDKKLPDGQITLLAGGQAECLQPAPARCKLNASTEDISVEVRGTIYLPVRKRSAKFAVVDSLHDGFRINDVQLPAVRDKK